MAILELLRMIFGLILVFFIPGYALTLAFFPRKTEITPIERIGLSFVLSIAAVLLTVLFMDVGFGIETTTENIIIGILLVTAFALTLGNLQIIFIRRYGSIKKEVSSAYKGLGVEEEDKITPKKIEKGEEYRDRDLYKEVKIIKEEVFYTEKDFDKVDTITPVSINLSILKVLRMIFDLILVLFISGYTLTLKLFPKKSDMSLIKRIGISLIPTIMAVLLTVLFMGLGLAIGTTVENIIIVILLVIAFALIICDLQIILIRRYKRIKT